MRAITIQAPAKINLRLVVLGREMSGYHSLETIFCGISLADTLHLERSTGGLGLEVVGEVDTGPLEQNLVARAAYSFYEHAGLEPSVMIRLTKRIPAAAGLGGGSSDAAATLRALNALEGEPLQAERLLGIAATLGSDVPFFLTRTPLALAWGRGERLLELASLPTRPVLIANPGVAISTQTAFRRLAELRGDEQSPLPHTLASTALTSWETLQPLAVNDLELVALERVTLLPHALRSLFRNGARIALLAGSGASIFGIFERPDALEKAEAEIASLGCATWRALTLAEWPIPEAQD